MIVRPKARLDWRYHQNNYYFEDVASFYGTTSGFCDLFFLTWIELDEKVILLFYR
jgi:hypothetical protein